MTSLIYKDGTVSVSNGSAAVTGNLTGWVVALVSGGMFSCRGLAVPILSVEDDTHLTLAYPWPGGTAVDAPYAIARDTSEAVRAAWTNDRLATIIQRLSLVGIHPDGSGTLAERDALDPVPATGYWWLYAEPGHALAFYRKSPSGWDGPFPVEGEDGGNGTPGPQGPAYKDYGVNIYNGAGIDAPGSYEADPFAPADSMVAKLFASLTDADAGSSISFALLVDGVMVDGPRTVSFGDIVNLSGLSIAVTEGNQVTVALTSKTGTVRGMFVRYVGDDVPT